MIYQQNIDKYKELNKVVCDDSLYSNIQENKKKMIVNYSLHKPPVNANANTLHLNISNTQNTRSIAPTGRQKIKSIQQDLNTFSSQKNSLGVKNDKVEQKQFKIRTCNNNKNGSKNITSVVGRPINHMMVVECKDKHKNVSDEELSNMIIKRMSLPDTPKDTSQKAREKQLFRPNGKNKQKVFDQIDIFKTIEPTELEFNTYNMTQFMPLAHRVQLSRNDLYNETSLSKKLILIVSFNLLNQECKKYRQSTRHHSSQLINNESTYSIQTTNLLKSLSGPQSSKNFLNNCKLHYKVSNERQLAVLEQFLYQNNFNNYSGIINVQDRYADSHNLYLLKGIATKDDSVVVLQDKNMLANEFPVLNGQRAIFILPKNNNYFNINQVIDNIKNIQFLKICDSPLKSHLKTIRKTEITDDSDKQNITPNRYHYQLMKNSSQKDHFVSLSPQKKRFRGVDKLALNGKLTKRVLDVNFHQLVQKSRCVLSGKLTKQYSKSRAGKQQSHRSVSIKTGRDRSLGKQRKDCSFEQNSSKINLQGDFKDKMVTFIKILQVQKKQRLQKKPIKNLESRKQSENDIVEELTNNITSKLKNKTNYQMVGEILRNNSHIAKQIGKYIKNITPLQQSLKQIQQLRNKSSDKDHNVHNNQPFQLVVYDYE